MLDSLKIAIVCDWLTVFAGAERVVLEMHQLFPSAPIYTTLYDAKNCPQFKEAVVHESGLRWIPGARRFHRALLPWMPKAFERMDLDEYDIVISSSHSASKGVITRPETLHVSYCHSPMRYVWDQSHDYQKSFGRFRPFQFIYKPILHRIRMWDRLAAERVDAFVVNSAYIGERVKKYYGKESTVIHPPVDLHYFSSLPTETEKENFYLSVGRLIPYKRVDLAIEACRQLGRPLKIIGEGPELASLKKRAGPQVEFLGKISDEELRNHYRKAKGLIFPAMEDFGIVPLEAMACGTPVLAYGKGGALETVKAGKSGLFFEEQTVPALVKTMEQFETMAWDSEKVRTEVESFASARFKSELRHFLEKTWKAHQSMLT